MRTWATRAPRLLPGATDLPTAGRYASQSENAPDCTWVTWQRLINAPWWCSPCSTPRPMTRARPTSRRSSSWPMPAARSCAWPSPRRSCLDTFRPCARIAFARRGRRALRCDHRHRAARRSCSELRINRQHRRLGENRCRARRRRAGRHSHPHRRERRLARPGAGRAQRSFASREAGRLSSMWNTAKAAAFTTWWSAQAHDVMTTVRTYRQLAREIPHIPLHIRRHRGGHRVPKASSKALPAWAFCSSRASGTPCASRSPTIGHGDARLLGAARRARPAPPRNPS